MPLLSSEIMSNIVLVSPIPCIDPAKPKSAEAIKQEDLQERMLEDLIHAIEKRKISVNSSIRELFGKKFADWDSSPYGEAFSCQPAISALSFIPHIGCLNERIEVVKTLTEHGYDVRMLAPTNEIMRYQRSYCLAQAESLGAKLLDTDEKMQQLTDWCRDGQMQIGKTTYNSPDLHDDWFAKLGCNRNKVVSKLGEGGRVVEGYCFTLVSEDTDETSMQNLRKDNLRAYKLPFGTKIRTFYKRDGTVAFATKGLCDHVDLFVNTLEAGKLIIVDPHYLSKCSKQLVNIAKREGYEILRVQPSEMFLAPTNYLTLPDGMILMNRAEKLYDELKRKGLAENVIMTPTKHHFNSDGLIGGIRCYTNIIKT